MSNSEAKVLRPREIASLNKQFEGLSPLEGMRKLFQEFAPEEILITSSFGASSVLLLDLLSKVRPDHPVHFIDTGFHFPETLKYRDEIVEKLGLNIVNLHPDEQLHRLSKEEEWWKEHPRMCCTINKTSPLEAQKANHTVWVSGVMAFQTPQRALFNTFHQQPDILKFHPLLYLPEADFKRRLDSLALPLHPLYEQGYESIGCSHCTVKGKCRTGRWANREKMECGLHLDYFDKAKSNGNGNGTASSHRNDHNGKDKDKLIN